MRVAGLPEDGAHFIAADNLAELIKAEVQIARQAVVDVDLVVGAPEKRMWCSEMGAH